MHTPPSLSLRQWFAIGVDTYSLTVCCSGLRRALACQLVSKSQRQRYPTFARLSQSCKVASILLVCFHRVRTASGLVYVQSVHVCGVLCMCGCLCFRHMCVAGLCMHQQRTQPLPWVGTSTCCAHGAAACYVYIGRGVYVPKPRWGRGGLSESLEAGGSSESF
jgi:hypothetical protein